MTEARTPPAAIAASATPALLERVSWGAVIAGALLALALMTLLNLFGLAIGLYAIDPQDPRLAAEGAAVTTGVWWALSLLVSLFAGGWVAGKLTGNPDKTISGLHGAAVWAVATLAAVLMVSSAASAVFTGAAGLVSRTAQATGQAAGGAGDLLTPAVNFAAEGLAQELQAAGAPVDPATLRQEASAVLNQAISPGERERLQTLAQNAALAAAQDPAAAETQLRQFIDQSFGADGVIGPEDRAQAVSALSARTGVPEPQLRQAIDNWQAQFASGGGEIDQRVSQLLNEAQAAVGDTATAVANAALWTGIGLLLALLAAVGGAVAGRPHAAGAPYART